MKENFGKDKHICDFSQKKIPSLPHGTAVTTCFEDENDKLWVENGEYINQVSFCPFCGYKSKVEVVYK